MNKKITNKIIKLLKEAKKASYELAKLSSDKKNEILRSMSQALLIDKALIIEANKKDLIIAKQKKLSHAFIDRLTLTDKRIESMAKSLSELANLEDPVGQVIKEYSRPNGLLIKKLRVPIGVICIIYESRPDVTSDCLGLLLKSGNVSILRGGSESINSNKAIFKILEHVANDYSLCKGSLNLIDNTDRAIIDLILKQNNFIDLVIPRGGEGLIKQVTQKSRIPVIKHYKGICHIYVDQEADLNMAENLCFNAKVQRPGVCNAMESMLVHKDAAIRFLPGMIKRLIDAGVEIRGCALTKKIAKNFAVKKAKDLDYRTEYLDLILSVKVVNNIDEAIVHINEYGSHHSDAIVTDNKDRAEKFLREIDSACVYVNASTRFTDGGQFGMGAEIGISTDKIHARGPMALEELTTYKYEILGSGQIRT